MRDALQLQVRAFRRAIVQEQDRALAPNEELLESQDLATVPQRTLRQQAHLRERIEDDAARTAALDGLQHHPRCLAQLDLGRIVHRQVRFGRQVPLLSAKLDHLDPVQRPAMRGCPRGQFLLGFRQREVETFFAAVPPIEQELRGERGLARTRVTFDQIQAVRDEAAAKHIIETRSTGRGAFESPGHASDGR